METEKVLYMKTKVNVSPAQLIMLLGILAVWLHKIQDVLL